MTQFIRILFNSIQFNSIQFNFNPSNNQDHAWHASTWQHHSSLHAVRRPRKTSTLRRVASPERQRLGVCVPFGCPLSSAGDFVLESCLNASNKELSRVTAELTPAILSQPLPSPSVRWDTSKPLGSFELAASQMRHAESVLIWAKAESAISFSHLLNYQTSQLDGSGFYERSTLAFVASLWYAQALLSPTGDIAGGTLTLQLISDTPFPMRLWQLVSVTSTAESLIPFDPFNPSALRPMTHTRIHLYLNNKVVATGLGAGVLMRITKAVLASAYQYDWHFPGVFDEFQFFDRKISQQEVEQAFFSVLPQPLLLAAFTGAQQPYQLSQIILANPSDEPLNPFALVDFASNPQVGSQSVAGQYNLSASPAVQGSINITLPQAYNLTTTPLNYTLTAQAQIENCSTQSLVSRLTLANACGSLSCLNGGYSSTLITGSSLNSSLSCVCTCLSGYAGADCSTLANACLAFRPCGFNASCYLSPTSVQDYFCQCNSTMIGRNCTVPSPLSTSSCNNATTLWPVFFQDFSLPLPPVSGVSYVPLAGRVGSRRGLATMPGSSESDRIDLFQIASSEPLNALANDWSSSQPALGSFAFAASATRLAQSVAVWLRCDTAILVDTKIYDSTPLTIWYSPQDGFFTRTFYTEASDYYLYPADKSNQRPLFEWQLISTSTNSLALDPNMPFTLTTTRLSLFANQFCLTTELFGALLTPILAAQLGHASIARFRWPGEIDSIALFNREISQREVEQLFYSVVPQPLPH